MGYLSIKQTSQNGIFLLVGSMTFVLKEESLEQ